MKNNTQKTTNTQKIKSEIKKAIWSIFASIVATACCLGFLIVIALNYTSTSINPKNWQAIPYLAFLSFGSILGLIYSIVNFAEKQKIYKVYKQGKEEKAKIISVFEKEKIRKKWKGTYKELTYNVSFEFENDENKTRISTEEVSQEAFNLLIGEKTLPILRIKNIAVFDTQKIEYQTKNTTIENKKD